MSHTLVLNADYTPLSIIPISSITWKDAVKLSFIDNADIIEEYPDWVVRSPSITMPVPSVMVSTEFIKKKHHVRFTRYNLMMRDSFKCQYCSKSLTIQDLTIDHVIPRARGGITSWDNCSSACYTCNSLKGHKTTMRPMTKPRKPTYHELLNTAKKMPITIPDESWKVYLGWDESLITVKPPNKNIHA